MKTFIKATEVWLPSSDRSLLEFGGGVYAAVPYFGATSRSMCFGRGEGLPGRTWDAGHPILLKQFEGSYFQRAAAAKEAGLSCAIAVPFFVADELSAVLVLFCGDDPQQAGAIELWRNDPRITSDITLADGYYGGASEALQSLTRDSYLPRGAGLPGLAWQRGASVFVDDVAHSTSFLRAESAAQAGINRGLAVPCANLGAASYVLDLLSSAEAPVAMRIEGWVPVDGEPSVRRTYGHCEIAGRLSLDAFPLDQSGAIGQAFAERRPIVNTTLSNAPGSVEQSAAAVRLTSVVALPVTNEGKVAEVVALYF